MATEQTSAPRTLVYQKYLTNRKTAFVLPEIVERMERAQDAVIRASHTGPLVISGPAGSGKTTLALHRIAYLSINPDYANTFKGNQILVLVQDVSTKAYFETLLPTLGIGDVVINTFSSWALELLELPGVTYTNRYGRNEPERDRYELAKYRALTEAVSTQSPRKSTFAWLDAIYASHFSSSLKELFRGQQKERMVDRFDLTALLCAQINAAGVLTRRVKVYDERVRGYARFKWQVTPVRYSLIVVDETQNYLPEQLAVVESCISPDTKAIIYVGDIAQRTALFTIRSWQMINANPAGREVTLEKIYRSTKQILEYIRRAGYDIPIPGKIRNGAPVCELVRDSSLPERVSRLLGNVSGGTVGILGIAPEHIECFRHLSSGTVRVMTTAQAQGVEFDAVVLIATMIDLSNVPAEIRKEKQEIVRDLLYVGLTRAVNRLFVVRDPDASGVPLRDAVLRPT